MSKLQKIGAIPLLVGIMLAQGVDLPSDIPRDEAEKIMQMLAQEPTISMDSDAPEPRRS